jgi:hypothetical protein
MNIREMKLELLNNVDVVRNAHKNSPKHDEIVAVHQVIDLNMKLQQNDDLVIEARLEIEVASGHGAIVDLVKINDGPWMQEF